MHVLYDACVPQCKCYILHMYPSVAAAATTTTTLLNQIIIDDGWPTPQIARKKANRGEASQIQEHTY